MARSPPRPSSLAFRFLVVLGLIVILARAAAVSSQGPWFSATVSLRVYVAVVMSALIAAIVATLLVAGRASWFDEVLSVFDAHLGAVHAEGTASTAEASSVALEALQQSYDRLEDTLYQVSAERARTSSSKADVVMPSAGPPGPTGPREEDLRQELATARQALGRARAALWPSVAGPIAVSVLFAALAGMVLPWGEEVAVTDHRLNTTFVLILGSGWIVVLFWLVTAIAGLPSFTVSPKGSAVLSTDQLETQS